MADAWYGSDRVADLLARLGCDHLVLNPGASLRGLHDSLNNPPGAAPAPLLALHEEIAVAMAHGYAKLARRPMAVALHDTVGLLHAGMALFNAWVDRAPLLALVGTGPLDATRRRPLIDWVHTVGEQGALVRDFTVWNNQPASLEAALESVRRAWAACQAVPGGPALVALDVLLQAKPADPPGGAPEPQPRPARSGPDPELVELVAATLRAARHPLLVTDRPLDEAASRALVTLAEASGAGLLDLGGGACFPVGHPHDRPDPTDGAARAARLLADLL